MNQAVIDALQQLSDERLLLDQVVKFLKGARRPEYTLAYRSAQLAFMALGKAKGVLHPGGYPYPKSMDPGSPVIEPGQDLYTGEIPVLQEHWKSEVAFAKAMRAQLDAIEPKLINDLNIFPNNRMYQMWIQSAVIDCGKAKMWLGTVLGIIREEQQENLDRKKAMEEAEAKLAAGAGLQTPDPDVLRPTPPDAPVLGPTSDVPPVMEVDKMLKEETADQSEVYTPADQADQSNPNLTLNEGSEVKVQENGHAEMDEKPADQPATPPAETGAEKTSEEAVKPPKNAASKGSNKSKNTR